MWFSGNALAAEAGGDRGGEQLDEPLQLGPGARIVRAWPPLRRAAGRTAATARRCWSRWAAASSAT